MRIKRGIATKKKHKKIKKQVKGFLKSTQASIKRSKQAILHAGESAFRGRKEKKRNFRRVWNVQISAGLKPFNLSYSKFIFLLKKNNILLNRKMLSNLAQKNPQIFGKIVDEVKKETAL